MSGCAVQGVEGAALAGEPERIGIAPPPPEGVEGPRGVGRVGRHVAIEELQGFHLAGGVGSGDLQGGREGLGECVGLGSARMGLQRLEVLGGRAAEAGVLPLELPVHLQGRRRVGTPREEEVSVEDGGGFRQGIQHARTQGARRVLGNRQTGVEMGAENDVAGLDVFDEEVEFVMPVEEGGIESLDQDDDLLDDGSYFPKFRPGRGKRVLLLEDEVVETFL